MIVWIKGFFWGKKCFNYSLPELQKQSVDVWSLFQENVSSEAYYEFTSHITNSRFGVTNLSRLHQFGRKDFKLKKKVFKYSVAKIEGWTETKENLIFQMGY